MSSRFPSLRSRVRTSSAAFGLWGGIWPHSRGFAGVVGRAACGQTRAFAGKRDTNLLPPCCHGIGRRRSPGSPMRPGCAARCWHGFGVVSADASRTKPAEKLRGNRAAFLDKQGMSGRQAQRAQHRHLSTREAAALLGVHQRTVRRYIAAGLLGNRKLPGGHYRIPQWVSRKPRLRPSSLRPFMAWL